MFKVLTKRECRRIAPLLWGYASGDLPAKEAEQVSAHLDHCDACRAEADGYRLAVSQITEYRTDAMPEPRATWEALRGRIEVQDAAQTGRAGRIGVRQAWAPVAAALVVAALL